MTIKLFHYLKRPILCLGMAALLSLPSVKVFAAAEIEGCDPKVMDAQKAVAEVMVAKRVADAEEVITKPDSVLAMTCFNQSAGNSATAGGNIFSGDFKDKLAPVVTTALNSLYDDFSGSTGFNSYMSGLLGSSFNPNSLIGQQLTNGLNNVVTNLGTQLGVNLGGILGTALSIFGNSSTVQGTKDTANAVVQYSTTLDNASANCNGIKNIWDQIQSKGLNKNIKQFSFNDLMQGTNILTQVPGLAGTKFAQNWNANASNNMFTNVTTAVGSLPAATSSVNYSNVKGSCRLLVTMGVLPSTTTCPN